MQADQIARPRFSRLDVHTLASDLMRDERVLLVYSKLGDARQAADALAHERTRAGLHVELAVARACGTPPPHDYDAVVIASCMWFGRHASAVVAYAAQYREVLADMPSFLCVVNHARGASIARGRRGLDWPLVRVHCLVRPRWRARWFGPPHAQRGGQVQQLALAIARQIPVRNPR